MNKAEHQTTTMQMRPGATHQTSITSVLWRRKGVILFCALCGAGIGYFYASQKVQMYRSAAIVEISRSRVQPTSETVAEQISDPPLSVGFIRAEITSDEVIAAAIAPDRELAASRLDATSLELEATIRRGLELTPATRDADSRDRAVLQVSFTGEDPEFARLAVEGVIAAYEAHLSKSDQQAIVALVNFLEEGETKLESRLQSLDAEYKDFQNRIDELAQVGQPALSWGPNGEAVNPYRDQANRLQVSVEELEAQLRTVQNKLGLVEKTITENSHDWVKSLRQVRYLVDEVSEIRPERGSLPSETKSDVGLRSKMMALKIQADLLAATYATNHPSLQTVKDELAATEKALGEWEAANSSDDVDRLSEDELNEVAAKALLKDYFTGLARRADLVGEDLAKARQTLETVTANARNLMQQESENASFLRQMARAESMLESYQTQLETIQVPEDADTSYRLEVLRRAGMGAPAGLAFGQTLVLSSLMGAMLGGLLGFLVDWSERTFRSPDEIDETLQIPLLAHVPVVSVRKAKRRDKESDRLPIHPIVVVAQDPHCPAAEAYRSLRTQVLGTSEGGGEYQVLQVTSALPGDGKSTLVANLAVSVALSNRRVVIVDADLRRPTQADLFGLENSVGVTSVLNGDVELEQALQPAGIDGLKVLTSGPLPQNPAEALSLNDFETLLEDLRMDFDFVIVDTPPLLAVTDASSVAVRADGVMLVMRIERNTKPIAKRAVSMLRALRANVVGVVVNAVGDSSLSAAYAASWSEKYGAQPGAEYGFGKSYYGADKYLEASRAGGITVTGHRAAKPTDREADESPQDATVSP